MNLTADQTRVKGDLIKYIRAKGIELKTPEDLDKAFQAYLLEGSVSHFYLQRADDHQRRQFRNRVKQELNFKP